MNGDIAKTVINLEMLTSDDSVKLLYSRSGLRPVSAEDESAAYDIAEELGYLPLALDSAGATIHNRKYNFPDYLRVFRKDASGSLLRYRRRCSVYESSIFNSLDMNFDDLEHESKEAKELFLLFAHLDKTSIPRRLLEEGVSNQWRPGANGEAFELTPEEGRVSPTLIKLIRDESAFGEAIEALLSFSLIYQAERTLYGTLFGYSLHPLVQRHAQLRLKNEEREQVIFGSVALVSHAFSRGLLLKQLGGRRLS